MGELGDPVSPSRFRPNDKLLPELEPKGENEKIQRRGKESYQYEGNNYSRQYTNSKTNMNYTNSETKKLYTKQQTHYRTCIKPKIWEPGTTLGGLGDPLTPRWFRPHDILLPVLEPKMGGEETYQNQGKINYPKRNHGWCEKTYRTQIRMKRNCQDSDNCNRAVKTIKFRC